MDRPRVITHNLASVDGRIAVSPNMLLMAEPRWPATVPDPYVDVMQRHHPQVLLEGSGSLVTEAEVPAPLPRATLPREVLLEEHLPAEATSRATRGWFAVVDGRGRVRWGFKEFPDEAWRGWHLLVLASASTPADYLEYLRREGIPYLVAGDGRVDLSAALTRLRALGARTVVATGGGRLNGALLRAGLVDEIEVEVLPLAIGGTSTPALFTAPDLGPEEAPTHLRLIGSEERPGGRVLLRYAVERPEEHTGAA